MSWTTQNPLTMTNSAAATLRIATYNIHKCRGIDMKFMPQRIISVLRELDADVVCL